MKRVRNQRESGFQERIDKAVVRLLCFSKIRVRDNVNVHISTIRHDENSSFTVSGYDLKGLLLVEEWYGISTKIFDHLVERDVASDVVFTTKSAAHT